MKLYIRECKKRNLAEETIKGYQYIYFYWNIMKNQQNRNSKAPEGCFRDSAVSGMRGRFMLL